MKSPTGEGFGIAVLVGNIGAIIGSIVSTRLMLRYTKKIFGPDAPCELDGDDEDIDIRQFRKIRRGGPAMRFMDAVLEGDRVSGTIDVLDVRFGSLWTNIPRTLFLETGVQYGDRVSITIENDTRCVYRNIIQYARSFADVFVGEALAYVNSLDCLAVAINQGSFARAYNIGTGNSWRIRIEPFKGFH